MNTKTKYVAKPEYEPTSTKGWEGFVVVGEGDYILGVYSPELEKLAQEQVNKIHSFAPRTQVDIISVSLPARPRVGDIIP